MLRSLVGSEMCIRDSSYRPLSSQQVLNLKRLFDIDFTYNSTAIEGNTYTCLLYTSDAADDLLCVDLGGRRIIKKKTNNKNMVPSKYTQSSTK